MPIYDKAIIIHNNRIITWILFILWPFGSLPLVFYEIYRGHRYALSLLSIFLGLYAILIPPSGDIFRYTIDYYVLKDENLFFLIEFCKFRTDYLLYCVLWILGKLNIPCDFYRFIFVYISSELIFTVYYDFYNSKKSNDNIKFGFLIFFLFFLNYNYTAAVIRNGFSTSLFFYGFYKIIIKHNKFGWLPVIFSFLNHLSFIIWSIVLLTGTLIKFAGNKTLTIILTVSIFFFSGDIINQVLITLPIDKDIVNHFMAYTDGYLAGEYLNDHSILFTLNRWLNRIPKIICYIIFCICFSKSKYSGILDFILFVIILSAPYEIMCGRFENATFLLFFFYSINTIFTKRKYRNTIITTLLITGIITSGSYFWTERRSRSISYHLNILYSSVPALITTNYSMEWINHNIEPDGNLILK